MTTVTALPIPPSSTDPVNFDARADAFLSALPLFGDELNALALEVNANTVSAANSEINAAASALTAATGANFKGTWASLGTNNVTMPSSVAHGGKFWQALQAYTDASTQTPGAAPAYWQEIVLSIPVYTYDNRNDLRTLSLTQCIVEGLGYFVFYLASTEIDDDETCFATATGRWIMEAAGPDFVLMHTNKTQEPIEAIETKLEKLKSKILFERFNPGITSLITLATDTFEVRIQGASIGDIVIVTPPSDTDFNKLVIHGAVPTINTVKIDVFNVSVNTENYVDLPWSIAVIRRI